jgi:hypothetical protein
MTMKRERGIRGSKGYVKVLDFSVWNSDFLKCGGIADGGGGGIF